MKVTEPFVAGLATVDLGNFRLLSCNETFRAWFADLAIGDALNDRIAGLDVMAAKIALESKGHYTAETTFRLRRRTITLALTFNRATERGRSIVVLACQNITRIRELEAMIDSYSAMVERSTRETRRDKEQVERLLLNMMPRPVYDELKAYGVVRPRLYAPAAAICLDFVDFARIVSEHDPAVVVSELNDIYTAFDRIGERFGCARVRTNGDQYITIAGVPEPSEDCAEAAANAAVRFLRYLDFRNARHQIKWECRIGLAAGSVIGSIGGVDNCVYDVFGPAVLEASRLRRSARRMKIAASDAMAPLVEAYGSVSWPE